MDNVTDGTAMSPGQVIKHLRMKLCMTQKDFGSAVGIPGHSIWMYESCRREPRLPNLKKIISFLETHGIVLTVKDFGLSLYK
jgi:DNA-binding XRE family transcriptional regulator